MSQSIVESGRVPQLSAELTTLVGRLNRAVTRAAGLDVPTARLRLLSVVEDVAPATIGELAAADHSSQPTMSAAVQALCDLGWAAKTPNPVDARSSLVSLTEHGRSVLADTRRRRAAVVTALFEDDPTTDEQDLATAVAVLRGLLSPDRPTVHRTTHQGVS